MPASHRADRVSQAWTTEETDWRDFPPTCECLAEAQVLNHRLAYVVDCVNISQVPMTPTSWDGSVQGKRSRYPFRDPYSDGRWLRQAYAPHPKRGPFRSEAELTRLNFELAARLERESRSSELERGAVEVQQQQQKGKKTSTKKK